MSRIGPRGTMAVACAAFTGSGIFGSGIGPALPELATRAGGTLAALGGMFTAIFLGALLMQLVAGPLSDRIGYRPVLLFGLLVMSLGGLSLSASHTLPLTLACGVITGLGQGAIIVSVNVSIAEVFADRSASALNLLNTFYGVGAFVGPVLAGLGLRSGGTSLLPLWVGVGLELLLVPLALLLTPVSRPAPAPGQATSSRALWRSPLLWMLGGLLLLYVGVETGTGGWAAAYMERSAGLVPAQAALVASGFWLALALGRIVGTLLGTRLTANALLRLCLLGALLGGLLLVVGSGSTRLTTAAIVLLGLCFGPIYPTMMAITTASFRSAPGAAASVAMALGSLGGMTLPWLQGILLEERGPATSMLLVAAGVVGMLLLHFGRLALAARRIQVPAAQERERLPSSHIL